MKPETRIIATFTFILAISIAPDTIQAAATASLLIPAIIISRTSPTHILKTIRRCAPYLIFIILMPEDKALLTLAKSIASVTALAILTATTGETGIIKGLKNLGAPNIFTSMLSFFITFMHTFNSTIKRMTLARKSRSFSKSQTLDIKNASSQIGCLMVRSFESSERIHDAMLARGWQGE